MKNSKELLSTLRNVRMDAIDAIVDFMESKGITEIDFAVDSDGYRPGDEDYNEDEVWDFRIQVECFGEWSDENGYITKVSLVDGTLEHTARGEKSGYEYPYGYVEDNAFVWVAVLEWIEDNLK